MKFLCSFYVNLTSIIVKFKLIVKQNLKQIFSQPTHSSNHQNRQIDRYIRIVNLGQQAIEYRKVVYCSPRLLLLCKQSTAQITKFIQMQSQVLNVLNKPEKSFQVAEDNQNQIIEERLEELVDEREEDDHHHQNQNHMDSQNLKISQDLKVLQKGHQTRRVFIQGKNVSEFVCSDPQNEAISKIRPSRGRTWMRFFQKHSQN
ncbi:hypothetical protein ABPG72_013582 [Tetrahymena utriculariae]